MDEFEPRTLRGDVANQNLVLLFKDIQVNVEKSGALPDLIVKVKKTVAQINEFELQPKLLDQNLQWYTEVILSAFLLSHLQKSPSGNPLAEVIYALAKVRGYKVVATHFSNDVYLVPQLILLMQNSDLGNYETFLVLLWLSLLVMVPFPLASIEEKLERQILQLAVEILGQQTNASRSQLVSLALLSNLLTRPDCVLLLREYVDSTADEWVHMPGNSKLGHLMALNQILKRFSNIEVAKLAGKIHSQIITLDFSQIKHNPGYQVNSLHILYLVKVSAKIARISINDNDFSTVASIINQLILDVMGTLGDNLDATLRETVAKNLSRIVSYLNLKAVNYAEQLTWFVVEQLQLPKLTQIEGFVTNLDITSETLNVSRYHTVLLFLGFVALTKAANYDFLPKILLVFHATCTISKTTFPFVQGSQLRDASCFCAWAVIRSIRPADFRALATNNMWDHVLSDLLRVTLFDEDFTIRRCGIAALQEFIGRFGLVYFGMVFPKKNASEIGELTLNFIELFDSSTVSSLKESHKIVLQLIDLGFAKSIFYDALFENIINEEVEFNARKLGGKILAAIYNVPDRHEWPITRISNEEITEKLILNLSQGHTLLLYTLAEFLNHDVLTETRTDHIQKLVSDVNFDHHHDNFEKAESLLHWYNASLHTLKSPTLILNSNLLSIARTQPSDGLIEEITNYFNSLVKKQVLPVSVHDIVRYIQHGNNLLAQTSMGYVLANNGLEAAMAMISNSAVDADVRAALITSLSEHVSELSQSANFQSFCDHILRFLDDYTLTNQGDVGLKVRGSTLTLIERNIQNHELITNLGTQLEQKLLRLSGEPMDKLRVQAHRLLCEMKVLAPKDANVYLSNYTVYFEDLTHILRVIPEDSWVHFWSGIVHSAGATTGNNSLTNASIRYVLQLEQSHGTDKIVTGLLKILKIPSGAKVADLDQRTKKTFNVTLTMLARLFEAGLEVSFEFPMDALFIRTYNMHINTSDVARIRQVLKIFQFMAIWDILPEFSAKARKRLCWLTCLHPLEKVRISGAECLFEVVNELSPENDDMLHFLDSTSWAKKAPRHLHTLESAILKM